MCCDALKNYDKNLCEAVFKVDETVSHESSQITMDFKVLTMLKLCGIQASTHNMDTKIPLFL